MGRRTTFLIASVSTLGLLVAACSGGPEDRATESPSASSPLQVIVANYELIADTSNRFIAGLVASDGRLVAYGTVQMRFRYLGTDGSTPDAQPSDVVAARYLPVPGTPGGKPGDEPQLVQPSSARGVYALEGVRFLKPGTWQVEAAADVDGLGVAGGAARFEVIDEARVPAPGESALRTRNHVLGERGVPAAAIDSRATNGDIPDPELHRTTIASAIAKGRPAVVVFSTPVFCVSRFCGPVTEVVEELAELYTERAEFIHVEIWRDFQKNVVNEAAADWLYRGDSLNEPWLFLIGPDGSIQARWDNLFTREEVEAELAKLRTAS